VVGNSLLLYTLHAGISLAAGPVAEGYVLSRCCIRSASSPVSLSDPDPPCRSLVSLFGVASVVLSSPARSGSRAVCSLAQETSLPELSLGCQGLVLDGRSRVNDDLVSHPESWMGGFVLAMEDRTGLERFLRTRLRALDLK
jgi:hypothetical protein